MPTPRTPHDKACAVRRDAGGGSRAEEPSSSSFYIILKVRPSAPSPKLMPTAPPDHCAPVLPQAAGALPLSSTSCCRRTLAHKQGLQVQTTLPLNTLFGGVPEELLGRAARAAQGCCSWSQAAGPAVGTGWAGHLTGETGRARRESRGCRVGFRALAHSRGSRSHVCTSGSRVSRRPIQK